ncbi:hypothetical protein HK104_007051 [Borealophlyctis nickersoniae]|nr:hypothetical protein HK104_007051 [Borealophlyctis nickersoniae]
MESAIDDVDFSSTDLLVKIRTQTNSGLENQKQTAILLTAVEETIREQNEQLTPLAYFGALMTILEQQREQAVHDAEKQVILVGVTYLLAIVFPRVPATVLRLKFQDIAKSLGATIEAHQELAPLVRSIIGCLECLLAAQDNAAWTTDPLCKKLFQVLLIMSLDSRPKVRRRSHEAVRRLLSRPPPPTLHHPGTLTAIDYSIKSLEDFLASIASASTKERREVEGQVLHALAFLKSTLPVLAVQGGHDKTRGKLKHLCEILLRLPVRSSGGGNTIMTQLVFQVLDALFGAGAEEERNQKGGIFPHLDIALLDSVIRALLEIRPYQNDAGLIPAWLELIKHGFLRLAELARRVENDVEELGSAERHYALNDYPDLIVSVFSKTFVALLGQATTKPVIIEKGCDLFAAMIRGSLTESMVDEAKAAGDEDKVHVVELLKVVNSGLTQIRYRDAWGGILKIAEAVFDRLGSVIPERSQLVLNNIMAFRDDPAYGESFPFKEELDAALTAAVQSLGLEAFVSQIPINIFAERPNQPRRPYLLALFCQAVIRPVPTPVGTAAQIFGPHTLRYFGSDMLPLAKRLFDKSGEMWVANRQLDAKLYETLGLQIWDMFPGLCVSLPEDVETSFGVVGPQLGQILQLQPSEVFPNLPSNPDLRPSITEGLQMLIEGYLAVVEENDKEDDDSDNEASAMRQMAAVKAERGIAKLKQYANQFLSTLCNNYTTIQPELLKSANGKGQALQGLHEKETQAAEAAIKSFLTIADEQAINSYFVNLVKTLLQSQTQQTQGVDAAAVQLAKLRNYAILDLLLILLPFLPEVRTSTVNPNDSPLLLFYRVLTGQLRDSDPTLQKKTYKSLNHVVQSLPAGMLGLDELVPRLLDPEVLSKAASGAKRARIQLLQRVAEAIPLTEETILLEFVSVALSEVMLATKEASEKARSAAYECLVAMGRKMADGGKTGRKKGGLWDMEAMQKELDAEGYGEQMDAGAHRLEREISLREYVMMVTAGLAGSTSAMQSAAMASLARLLFEFSNIMDDALLEELVSTVLYFMDSKNREIIKAALGFIKVAVVTLNQELLEENLETIVVSILTHSRDHKSHFKAKVRHIFERLVRKFSYEAIEGFVPEQDKKLLVNIKKRRDRFKKQKAQARREQMNHDTEEGSDDNAPTKGKKTKLEAEDVKKKVQKARQNAFEDALYGSESELESDGDDDEDYIPEQFREGTRKKSSNAVTMIREDQDVVDFLDSNVVSRVTSGPAKKRSSKHAANYTTAEDGRMVFAESDSEEGAAAGGPAEPMDQEDYYKQSLRAETAIVRTPDGRVKFAYKANKRKRDDDDEEADEEKGATGSGLGWKQGARGKNVNKGPDEGAIAKMLGKQYKAKKAKGDVKKAGMPDPYAYIPLNAKVVGGAKRKSAKAAGTFKGIVKAAQKGSEIGSAARAMSQKAAGVRKTNKKHK